MNAPFDADEWDRFCAEEVRGDAARTDREAFVSPRLWSGIAERGYLALFHSDTSHDLHRAMRSLARACGSTFWQATISSALAGRMISELAPKMTARFVPGLTNGALLGCFAATERPSGSDPGLYTAAVHRRAASWVLRGEKTRISNGPDAHVAAVLCRAVGGDPGEDLGLALAVVDLRARGVARTRLASLGLRGMGWGTLHFDDVELTDDSVVPDMTMARALRVVEWGQVIQAVCALGAAERALGAVTHFLADRVSFGRPLSRNEVVQHRLDGAWLEIDAANLLVRRIVAQKSRGEVSGNGVVIAKIFATEAGVRACQTALELSGGWGYSTELEVERLLRDAYGNVPAGLANDRLRDLLVSPRLGVDPWRTRS